MKVTELFERFERKTVSIHGGPKWTVPELAAEWGLTINQLNGLRRKYPGFPEVAVKANAGHIVNKRVYYDLHDAKKWFASVKAKLGGDIEKMKSDIVELTKAIK